MYSKLQYISQGVTANDQIRNIKSVLDAGCEWIQLRFKNEDLASIMSLAEQVKDLCSIYQAVFIVNDRVDIAKSVDASGVHLGLQDMAVIHARNILGEQKIIGGTANTMEDVMARMEEKCNYIGLGPFRFTVTKEKLSPVLGLEGYKKIVTEIEKNKTKIPLYAIGGVTIEDVAPLRQAGVYGVAVSGAVTNSSDKKRVISDFNSELKESIL